MLHGVLHYCDHSQKNRAGLDLRPLTFIRESGLAQRCDVDVAFVKFSCDKCCPSLRPVYSSDTHERSNIPCASSDRCFHFDYTGETGYSWGTLCSPYFRPWRWAEQFLRLLRLPGGLPNSTAASAQKRATTWPEPPVCKYVTTASSVSARAGLGLGGGRWWELWCVDTRVNWFKVRVSCVFSSASLSRPHWDIWTSSRTWLRR